MNVVILPGKLKGEVTAPPSKSMAHRLLIRAALSDEPSVIRHPGNSEDVQATLDCLTALGMKTSEEPDGIRVTGGIPRDGEEVTLPCRESGSTMRFLLPVAAALRDRVTVTGSRRLIDRGIGVYETLFRNNGIRVTVTDTEIRTEGRLKAGNYGIPGNISSQFTSGLLFALSLCAGDSRLTVLPPAESRPYTEMTAEILNRGGAEIRKEEADTYRIRGGTTFHGTNTDVEGDWSNAAVLYALNSLGHEVTVLGTVPDSLQGDRSCMAALDMLKEKNVTLDLSDTPDLGPILFAAAAAGNGALFTGTRRLAIKESNRTESLAAELAKFGIRCEAGENSVRVLPGTLHKPDCILDGHNDHRIVTALTALCSLTGGIITGAEAVNKSWPEFFDTMKKLGMNIRMEETF